MNTIYILKNQRNILKIKFFYVYAQIFIKNPGFYYRLKRFYKTFRTAFHWFPYQILYTFQYPGSTYNSQIENCSIKKGWIMIETALFKQLVLTSYFLLNFNISSGFRKLVLNFFRSGFINTLLNRFWCTINQVFGFFQTKAG